MQCALCLLTFYCFVIVVKSINSDEEYTNSVKYCTANNNYNSYDSIVLNASDLNGSIFNYTFSSLYNRKILCIENSFINYIQDGALCSTPFEQIVLYHNRKFPNLSKRFFGNCPTIKTLKLISNHMGLEKDAFSTLYYLIELELIQVQITRLTRQYFKDLFTLKSLTIIDCNIEEIDNGAFDSLGDLEILKIANNHLHRIDGVLQNLRNLINLTILEHVSNFPWDDLRYLDNLEYLNIGYLVYNYDTTKIAKYMPRLKWISLPKYEFCHVIKDIKRNLKRKLPNIRFGEQACMETSNSTRLKNNIYVYSLIIFVNVYSCIYFLK